MAEFYLDVGDSTSFTKTVSESDVYQFAGITGDFSPNHVNRVYMEKSSYGRLMAHGALLVGFMSTVSTQMIAHSREAEETPVSVGYDKVRFLKPVFLGDTITVAYTVTEIDWNAAVRQLGSRSPTRMVSLSPSPATFFNGLPNS